MVRVKVVGILTCERFDFRFDLTLQDTVITFSVDVSLQNYKKNVPKLTYFEISGIGVTFFCECSTDWPHFEPSIETVPVSLQMKVLRNLFMLSIL